MKVEDEVLVGNSYLMPWDKTTVDIVGHVVDHELHDGHPVEHLAHAELVEHLAHVEHPAQHDEHPEQHPSHQSPYLPRPVPLSDVFDLAYLLVGHEPPKQPPHRWPCPPRPILELDVLDLARLVASIDVGMVWGWSGLDGWR